MNNIVQFLLKSNFFLTNLENRLFKFSPKLYLFLDFLQKLFFWMLKRFLVILLFLFFISLSYQYIIYSICFTAGAAVALLVYLKHTSKSEFYAETYLIKISKQNNLLQAENESLRQLLLNSYQSYVDLYLENESLTFEREWIEESNLALQGEKNKVERELRINKKFKDHFKQLSESLKKQKTSFCNLLEISNRVS